MNRTNGVVYPISHVKTNQKVFDLLHRHDLSNVSILDVGAGEGYFSKLLGESIEGRYSVPPKKILRACDLFPENFKYGGVTCDRVDQSGKLPYEDNSYHYVCSLEVIEHVENQFAFVRELHRVLKKSGRAIITTPNILNINSRIRFLHSGFWLLYDPLSSSTNHPVHDHINPISLYYLTYMLYKAGFREVHLHFDKVKRSGLIYCFFLYPLLFLAGQGYNRRIKRKYPEIYRENREILRHMNRLPSLVSRTIILEGIK